MDTPSNYCFHHPATCTAAGLTGEVVGVATLGAGIGAGLGLYGGTAEENFNECYDRISFPALLPKPAFEAIPIALAAMAAVTAQTIIECKKTAASTKTWNAYCKNKKNNARACTHPLGGSRHGYCDRMVIDYDPAPISTK